ncbi:MAG: RluA family pseudouridine synthase [Myxococcales bacterium]|nr:RluA family pseudouridine synthase [Myxococcales bacterium]
MERRLVVTEELAGLRLDHYLVRIIPRLSRTRIQAVIATQLTRADGRRPRSSMTVAAGDELVLRRAAKAEPPCPRTFDVLYQDGDVMIVDKPAGLPVHASAKFYWNTLHRVVAERFPDTPWQLGHRLDRETSGALALAAHKEAAAALKGAFEHKRAAKTYLAICHGQPSWPDADGAVAPVVLDAPLALSTRADGTRLPGVRMVVRADGLPAITKVSVLERAGAYALVRCDLVTGRQHQIRAHLAHAGFPIVGDKLYAHGDAAFIAFCDHGMTRALATQFQLPRHALHAHRLRVPHPRTGAPLEAVAPLAWDLAAFLAAQR